MPSLRRLPLIAGLLLLTATAPVFAAWSPLGGPIRPVITLQLDPSRPALLYSSVHGSEGPPETYLWRSGDAGATWRNVQAGLEHPVSSLAIDPESPEVIWAWTANDQLWRSADAGDTWSLRYTLQTGEPRPQVLQLLVDPHHPGTIYRVDHDGASPGTRVAVSRNGGVSFSAGPFVLHFTGFDSLYVQAGRDELVSFDQKGLEVSADGGRTWSVRGQYRQHGFVGGRLAPSNLDVLYGLPFGSSQCLARSDDAGAHWRPLAYPSLPSAHSTCYDVAIDPQDARHVWVAAQVSLTGGFRQRLFESRDGGATWSLPFSLPAPGVVAAGGEVLYAGGVQGSGLYVSRDGGRTWSPIDQGIAAGDLRDGFVAQRLPGGGRRLFGLAAPNGGSADAVWRSDGGRAWTMLPFEVPVAIAGAGGSTILVLDDRGVVRSQNGGDGWQIVAAAPPQPVAFLPDVTQPRFVALLAREEVTGSAGNLVLWLSDDGGAAWRRSGPGLPIACVHIGVDLCPEVTAYAVDPFNPGRRWVTSVDPYPPLPRVFLSEDAGASWQMATAAAPPIALSLAADPEVENRILVGTDGGLFVSEDGGRHWLPLGDLPDGAVVRQLIRDAGSATWYAATIDRGIYRSLDGGAHWTLLAGAPDHDNPVIAVDPRRPTALLAAFRGQGVWRWAP